MTNIKKGEVGTTITATITDSAGTAINISTATSKKIYLVNRSGRLVSKDASFTTNGSDGKLYYTLVAGDIDIGGAWVREWKVIMPSGTWYTSVVDFEVDEVLA